MIRFFFDPQKISVPYLTPSSTFIPYTTLRWIFHPRTVNCDVKRRFCPCGPHHPSPSSPPFLPPICTSEHGRLLAPCGRGSWRCACACVRNGRGAGVAPCLGPEGSLVQEKVRRHHGCRRREFTGTTQTQARRHYGRRYLVRWNRELTANSM